MHAVVPQRDVEMAGETGLRQLQPAPKVLQTAEQGEAEGGAGGRGGRRGLHLDDGGLGDVWRRLGRGRFRGFRLRHFTICDGWWGT